MQPTPDGRHVLDLSAHEQHRLAAVVAATPDLDPGRVLADEAEAHRMLYSGLDAGQLATYRMLVAAGVLDA
ncbi:hypothetical protein BJF78_04810 [Pseudonocardia sp. CNS-139]|nr:hypothetical protein BJF78_04810 [Pseudonocardia sp. CNS-139]